MGYSLSPAVNVSESDLTNVVPAIATTAGAFAGAFQWGPALEVTTVSSEKVLADRFFKPNDDTAVSFFSAANFLAYGNNLQVVRVVGEEAKNATALGTTPIQIPNQQVYDSQYADGSSSSNGSVAAKYPGKMGNSLRVSMADSSSYSILGTGAITTSTTSTSVDGTSTAFATQVAVGSVLKTSTGAVIGVVASVSSATSLTLTSNALVSVTDDTFVVEWEFASLFGIAPSTSAYAASVGGSNDEVHMVIIDADGAFSGTRGYVLDTFAFASKASDAKNSDGTSNYYKEVINRKSQQIWWMAHPTAGTNWGTTAHNTTFTTLGTALTFKLSGGVDGNSPTDADIINGYMLFANDEKYDVSLIVTGDASSTVQTMIINDIAETRKDCVPYMSPPMDAVVNNYGNEANDIVAWRNSLPSTSYGFGDSGWKYQYDRYNDVYRWIPLNGDIAGTAARTDSTNDPWWSHAGYTRGQIKNVVKLAYSPDKTDRDTLYKNGVNPVVSFPGQGTILYGDKTLQSKPSAFDRINVRRLFIVLEKSIATAAKYQLFEFNDIFSRAQFRNLVEPFLRDVQGRRGITSFKVVCDETNNTPQVINTNNFVADIFIVPNYSINYIQLNFIASKNGVQFTTTGG